MASEVAEAKASGRVIPKSEPNTRAAYEHQEIAMQRLDKMNLSPSYSTLVVLPTGGGKTYTMSMWLLKTALDRHKKVLWMAHRHLLLEQAAESFQKYSYAEVTPHIDSFRFRIVSGAVGHDRLSDIAPGDDLLIISKDSAARNPACLDEWLDGLQELYFIIDEAHHSTAKSYRKVIDYVKAKVPNVKLIGLTATPFQKDIDDPGLLREVYKDNIAYEIGLKSLIAKQILSKPTFEERYTEEEYGDSVGLRVLESIQRSDLIPDDIAEKMATSAVRNQLIVDTYLAHRKKYGQTIVFAVNIIHAVQLTGIFKNAGIKADYVVSGFRDAETGALVKKSDNDRKIEAYRRGELQVLISVNILTEGVDLPKTKSVFLARPTVSAVLMTQMVGRALRGTAAGGTAEAYIVSFIDKWNEYIAWVNPQSLLFGAGSSEADPVERAKSDIRTIAVSKIEEFAKILDDSIDTTTWERRSFLERIPQGMYCIRLEGQSENGDGADYIDHVMVYNNAIEGYVAMMSELPSLFESYQAAELEYLPDDMLSRMERQCYLTYFDYPMVPPYHSKDVRNILRYYAQYGRAPRFYSFDDIDRSKLDVQKIAQHIWNARLTGQERRKYENSIWAGGDDNMLRLLFGKKIYFLRQIDIEYLKIAHPDVYAVNKTVRYGNKEIADLTLAQIRDIDPDEGRRLMRAAFDNFKNGDGEYWCAKCGEVHAAKVLFHVTHILPLKQGGKSVPSNMQILCRSCYEKEKQ